MLPYTVNDNFDKATAIAIQEGKIIAIGTNEESAANTNLEIPSMLRQVYLPWSV
jgi:predicted amidohydrolase YtcJ